MNENKPVLLCILDGWGLPTDNKYNAIAKANTPVFDRIFKEFPHSTLEASGSFVGLPEGQMGNSEVGHTNIGAGRLVMQDLPKINKAVRENTIKDNQRIKDLVEALKASKGDCHLLGLLSEGGVHSHQNQMAAIAKTIASQGVSVKLHAFLDGRDVAQKSALQYIEKFKKDVEGFDVEIATVGGRYYGMDRDKRWDRIEKAYDVILEGVNAGSIGKNPEAVVEESYKNELTDEFILPTAIEGYQGMKDGDAFFVTNFRADRVRQISETLANKDFKEFNRKKTVQFIYKLGLVEYSVHLSNFMETVFPPEEIVNSLGEVVSRAGLKQLRIAETEKYAHVTFFFNGGKEEEFEGEERILIKSPDVATYDLKPEMSADEVTTKLLERANKGDLSLIVVNYANPDMVGHTGKMDAAIKACETVDRNLGQLLEGLTPKGWTVFVTADHGNAEKMFDDKSGQPYTAHTTSKVPFVMVTADENLKKAKLNDGSLCNIAGTILDVMNVEQPKEIECDSLLVK